MQSRAKSRTFELPSVGRHLDQHVNQRTTREYIGTAPHVPAVSEPSITSSHTRSRIPAARALLTTDHDRDSFSVFRPDTSTGHRHLSIPIQMNVTDKGRLKLCNMAATPQVCLASVPWRRPRIRFRGHNWPVSAGVIALPGMSLDAGLLIDLRCILDYKLSACPIFLLIGDPQGCDPQRLN